MAKVTNEIIDEQRKKMLEDFKQFRESGISSGAKVLAKAIQDKEFMEKATSSIVRMIDGETVNIDPLPEIPIPEMRLYFVDENYFESIDELLMYCRINKISTKGLNIIDYYRNLAGHSDVIRKSNSETSMLYTAIDEDGYGLYNNKRSVYRGEFIWEYNYGNIRDLYKPFKEKGIVFENDVYGKIDERNQHILKYCRENNLFNMRKSDS